MRCIDIIIDDIKGNVYHHGIAGQPVDFVRAKDMYLRAAMKGDPSAQNNLGICFSVSFI